MTTALGRGQLVAPADQPARATRLRGKWLLMAGAGWIALVGLTLVLAVIGFVIGFDDPALLAQATIRAAVTGAGAYSS
jgi:hypothetical protein